MISFLKQYGSAIILVFLALLLVDQQRLGHHYYEYAALWGHAFLLAIGRLFIHPNLRALPHYKWALLAPFSLVLFLLLL